MTMQIIANGKAIIRTTIIRTTIIRTAIIFLTIMLAACNSTDNGLTPLESVGAENNQAPVTQIQSPTANNLISTQEQLQTTTPSASFSVHFTPIIGAPIQAVTPLSQKLAIEASKSGIAIVSSDVATRSNDLKGYLSAYNDGEKTNVIYVWDVLNKAGNREYRIQGQKSSPLSISGNNDDPWANVTASTMEEIASETIATYLSWRQTNPQ